MKKLIVILLGTFLMSVALDVTAQAQQSTKSKTKAKAFVKADDSPMPYTASYSSQFIMGDPAKGRIILSLWKDFDENDFDRNKDMFADTVTMYLANGMIQKGRDSMLIGVKAYRNSLADVKSTVHAWMSLRSVDQNHDWVAIWGSEEITEKDGKKSGGSLHEIWRFNKDGKVDEMRQFTSTIVPDLPE